jgi:hypothetical protein
VFVLNNDQRKWLTGDEMNFAENKVFLTAHLSDTDNQDIVDRIIDQFLGDVGL